MIDSYCHPFWTMPCVAGNARILWTAETEKAARNLDFQATAEVSPGLIVLIVKSQHPSSM